MKTQFGITRLVHDDAGSMMAVWGVSFAALLGIAALSFDMGRVAATQTELQSFADAVALAAAGELDGHPDALIRARTAAALITDTQTYGAGAAALSVDTDVTLTFHDALPNDDRNPITTQTTEARDAVYARAVITPREVGLTFGAAFSALSGADAPDSTARASAVAGFTQYACDITPLMFCIPEAGFDANASTGRMIRLRSGGKDASWAPGDFGFLDPKDTLIDPNGPCAGKTGVNLTSCLIGANGSITRCFSIRGVDIEPGQKVGIEDAIFNVRFDIFKGIMNGERNNAAYAPAPNVIKGIVPASGGQCVGNNEAISPDTVGIPRDDCLTLGTCDTYGDGDWSLGRADYVATNYGGIDPHPSALTRYDYYKAEIDAAGGGASTNPLLIGKAETGRPQCSMHQATDPDRRVVVAAAIDCNAYPLGGAAEDVPVEEFVKLFLTEPVGDDGLSPPTLDIWAEVIGSAGGDGSGNGDDGGIFRDVVQLYR